MSLETMADASLTLQNIEERLSKVVYVVNPELKGIPDGVQLLLDDAKWMARKLRAYYQASEANKYPKEIA